MRKVAGVAPCRTCGEFLCSASHVILCRHFCIIFGLLILWSWMVELLHCFIGIDLLRAAEIDIWAPVVMQPSTGNHESLF